MTQIIIPTLLPAPSLNDNKGTGIIQNRDVVVEGNDIEPGAISDNLYVAHTDPIIIQPGDFAGLSNLLRSDELILEPGQQPLLTIKVTCEFEGFDNTNAGPNQDDLQVSVYLNAEVISDGNNPRVDFYSIVRLVYDDASKIYTPYTGEIVINLSDVFPNDNPASVRTDVRVGGTEMGFTSKNMTVDYIGTRS